MKQERGGHSSREYLVSWHVAGGKVSTPDSARWHANGMDGMPNAVFPIVGWNYMTYTHFFIRINQAKMMIFFILRLKIFLKNSNFSASERLLLTIVI